LAVPLGNAGLLTGDLELFAELPCPNYLVGRILSDDGEGKPPFIKSLSLGRALATNLVLGITLAELVQALRPYEMIGITKFDLDKFSQLGKVDFQTIRYLSSYLNDEYSEESLNVMDPAHLYRAAVVYNRTPEQIAEAMMPLAEARLVEVNLPEATNSQSIQSVSRYLLSHDFDDRPPWRTDLKAFDIAFAAHRLGVPVRDLSAAVDDLDRCGVDVTGAREFLDFLLGGPVSVVSRTAD
jgi:hypothetical protein